MISPFRQGRFRPCVAMPKSEGCATFRRDPRTGVGPPEWPRVFPAIPAKVHDQDPRSRVRLSASGGFCDRPRRPPTRWLLAARLQALPPRKRDPQTAGGNGVRTPIVTILSSLVRHELLVSRESLEMPSVIVLKSPMPLAFGSVASGALKCAGWVMAIHGWFYDLQIMLFLPCCLFGLAKCTCFRCSFSSFFAHGFSASFSNAFPLRLNVRVEPRLLCICRFFGSHEFGK